MNVGMIRFKGQLTAMGPIHVNYIDMDGRLPRTPHGEAYLNGGTLRGPLRKAALRSLRRLLAERQGRSEKGLLSLTDEYMLGSGIDRTRAVNNEKDAGADPIGQEWLREVNPLLSMFGRWNLPSRLETGEMRTSVDNLVVAGQGARHDQFERDPESVALLDGEDLEALQREIRSARESAKAIEGIRKAIAQKRKDYRVAETDAERKTIGKEITGLEKQVEEARASREGAEHSIKHPLSGQESIASGSILTTTLGLVNGKQAYLGILLRALAEFAREPYLGGHRNTGFGRIAGTFEAYQWAVGELAAKPIGSISFDEMGVTIDGGILQQAYDAVPDMLDSWNLHIHTIEAAREFREAQ